MPGKGEPRRPVAAVRAIIPNAGGRVLVVKRTEAGAGGGRWCLPGGKVDYGETLAQAVAKEVLEETALRTTGSRFLFVQDSLPYEEGGMHCINLYFECTVEGEIVLNPESTEYAWLAPEDLGRYRLTFRHDEGLERYWHGGPEIRRDRPA